jgi:hypothetical protein
VNRGLFLTTAMMVVLAHPAFGNTIPRRATIVGGGGGFPRCTIEVMVDGSAEVEIFADSGQLTTLSGRDASGRQYQCSAPLPHMPLDFRLFAVEGRGSVRVVREPRSNSGRAVVRIDDPQGGSARYRFDFQWQGASGGGWSPGPPPDRGPGRGGFPMAMRACQDSVTANLNQQGYPYVNFTGTTPDDNPGRHDWVTGSVTATRRFGSSMFTFSCSVDFNSGRVRSVDVRPLRR